MTAGLDRASLIVVAGEAERVVAPWRRRFDPEAVARGIPPHITILFPFVRSPDVDAELLEERPDGRWSARATFPLQDG